MKILNWLRSTATAILVVSSLLAPVQAHAIPEEVVQHFQKEAFYIELPQSSGSGFWIDDTTLVTACHVVGDWYISYDKDIESATGELVRTEYFQVSDDVTARDWQGVYEFDMTVVSCDTDQDIAILKTQPGESYKGDHLPVYTGFIPQGTEVWGGGYPMNFGLIITEGHWQGPVLYKPYSMYDKISAPTIYGDSGSATVAYIDGELQIVGIRQAVRSAPSGSGITHLVMVSKGMYIQKHLDDYNF